MTSLGTLLIGFGAALIAGAVAFGKPGPRTYPTTIVFEPDFDALPGVPIAQTTESAPVAPSLAPLRRPAPVAAWLTAQISKLRGPEDRVSNVPSPELPQLGTPVMRLITPPPIDAARMAITARGSVIASAIATATTAVIASATTTTNRLLQRKPVNADDVAGGALQPIEPEVTKPAPDPTPGDDELVLKPDPIPQHRRISMLFARLRLLVFGPAPELDTTFLDDLPPASALQADDERAGTAEPVPLVAVAPTPALQLIPVDDLTPPDFNTKPVVVDAGAVAEPVHHDDVTATKSDEDVELVVDLARRRELEQQVLADRDEARSARTSIEDSTARAMDEALAAADAARATADAEQAARERLKTATAWAREITKSDEPISLERRRVLLDFYADLPNGLDLLRRVRAEDPEMSARAAELIAERDSRAAA